MPALFVVILLIATVVIRAKLYVCIRMQVVVVELRWWRRRRQERSVIVEALIGVDDVCGVLGGVNMLRRLALSCKSLVLLLSSRLLRCILGEPYFVLPPRIKELPELMRALDR